MPAESLGWNGGCVRQEKGLEVDDPHLLLRLLDLISAHSPLSLLVSLQSTWHNISELRGPFWNIFLMSPKIQINHFLLYLQTLRFLWLGFCTLVLLLNTWWPHCSCSTQNNIDLKIEIDWNQMWGQGISFKYHDNIKPEYHQRHKPAEMRVMVTASTRRTSTFGPFLR